MHAGFCVEALKDALAGYGVPGIFDAGRGSQFTGTDFTDMLRDAKVGISMDGRGRWIDRRTIRAALTIPQIRMRRLERLRNRLRNPGRDRRPDHMRQRKTPALVAWAANARRGLRQTKPRSEGCRLK